LNVFIMFPIGPANTHKPTELLDHVGRQKLVFRPGRPGREYLSAGNVGGLSPRWPSHL